MAVGSNPTVGETAGTGHRLDDYESSIACTGDSTASLLDAGPLELGELAAGDVVDCTITNTRKPRVNVTKELVPETDGGLFDLQVNEFTRKNDASHGDSTDYVNVAVGSNPTVGEIAGTGTTSAITSPRSRARATARLVLRRRSALARRAGRGRHRRLHDHEQAQAAPDRDRELSSGDRGLFDLQIDGATKEIRRS